MHTSLNIVVVRKNMQNSKSLLKYKFPNLSRKDLSKA